MLKWGESQWPYGLEWYTLLGFTALLMLSTALAQATAIVLILLWIWKSFRYRSLLRTRSPLELPFFAFFLARLLSIPFGVDPSRSIQALWLELPFYFIFFALAVRFMTFKREQLVRFLTVWIGAGVLAAAIGSVRYVFGFVDRAASTTSGYYTLGMYLTVLLCLILPFGKATSLFRNRWLWGGSATVAGIGILLTLNRIHWGIAGAMIAVIGLWKERRLLALAAAASVVVVLTIPGVRERFSELLAFTSQTTGRDVLWKGGMELATERPIVGFGPRSFPVIFPYFDLIPDKGVGTWHNDVLQVFLESGAIGLATYLWLLVTAFVVAIRNVRSFTGDELLGPLSIGLLMAVIALVLGGLVGGFITDPLITLLFRQVLALIAVVGLSPPSLTRSAQSPR